MAHGAGLPLDEIAARRAAGASFQKIAILYGVSWTTIRRMLLPPEEQERDREGRRISTAKYDAEHADRRLGYRIVHRSTRNLRNAEYYNENKVEISARGKASRERRRAELAVRRIANRGKHNAQMRTWRAAHPKRARATMARYRKRHPDLIRGRNAERRALLRAATIGDREKIKRIYSRALDPKPIRCYYCHEFVPLDERHVDHVWPLSRHGPHAAFNLVICHASCNLKKRAKLPEEVGLLL
jgi:5-methylcytosine-specific restriction endonuclease McrA